MTFPTRQAWAVASIVLLLSSCAKRGFDRDRFIGSSFTLVEGGSSGWSEIRGEVMTVLITLDPECPFCLGYAPVIDSLEERYRDRGVRFVGLYPAGFIHTDSAARFARTSGFDFPQVMDADCSLALALRARVTPECFVLDADARMIYHGAVDNWAVRAGRHKSRATKHYLADALDAATMGRPLEQVELTAVGCIVECDGLNE